MPHAFCPGFKVTFSGRGKCVLIYLPGNWNFTVFVCNSNRIICHCLQYVLEFFVRLIEFFSLELNEDNVLLS